MPVGGAPYQGAVNHHRCWRQSQNDKFPLQFKRIPERPAVHRTRSRHSRATISTEAMSSGCLSPQEGRNIELIFFNRVVHRRGTTVRIEALVRRSLGIFVHGISRAPRRWTWR